MNTIMLDDATTEQLRAMRGPVQFRTRTGDYIGEMDWTMTRAERDALWDSVPDLSDEEMDRVVREGKLHTPDEVMARLRSLG